MSSTHEDVINFWFHEPANMQERIKLWFGGTPDQDKLIKERFGDLVEKARSGQLAHWEDLSEGSSAGLAFILLLDQFCRNIYRGTADMFSHDHKALAMSLKMFEAGKDKELPHIQRMFIYLPLEHSESLDIQKKCVAMFRDFVEDSQDVASNEKAFIQKVYSITQEHLTVITQFGRFPKRNEALGRESTPEELEIMQQWPYRF